MKTLIVVHLGLAPLIAFWALLGFASPEVALAAGLAVSLAMSAWRWARREAFVLEIGALAAFLVMASIDLARPVFFAGAALWLSFVGLGLTALVSVVIRRPWTADYSRAAFSAESASPLFFVVNMTISALWAALFLLDALVLALKAGGLATTAIFVLGAVASIYGPMALIRFVLERRIAAASGYRWPAPRFDRAADEDSVDVAVVGAGIGGLSAAALLADAGLKVAVYEAHVVPGGYCHTFLRKARHDGRPCVYRFDAGPHDFSGVHPGGSVDAILTRLGVADRLDWRRLDHSYRFADRIIDPPRDWREYATELGRQFPADAAGLKALFEEIKAISDGMYATGADNGGIPGLPGSAEAMLAFARRHPLAVKWMERPFDELVARHVSDPQAKRALVALTGYVSDGNERLTCAQMVPLFGYYFAGGFYPVGGSQRFADAVVEAIEARGGRLQPKTRVERILVENGRAVGVALAGGRRVAATAVVSNADVRRTFLELVGRDALPARFVERLAAAAPGPSAFMVHLGVDTVPDCRPALHLIDSRVGVEVLTKVDPSAAPAGHSTVGIVKLLTNDEARAWFPAAGGDDWKALRVSPEYEAKKHALADAMIAAAETALPGLSAHIVHRSEASPVTYARYDLSSDGAIYGVARSGRLSGAKSPIRNLVVAGGATHGPGVEAVVISGAHAAEALVPGLLARRAAAKEGAPRENEPARIAPALGAPSPSAVIPAQASQRSPGRSGGRCAMFNGKFVS
jgi:phytoene dehydrogenase-like protein